MDYVSRPQKETTRQPAKYLYKLIPATYTRHYMPQIAQADKGYVLNVVLTVGAMRERKAMVIPGHPTADCSYTSFLPRTQGCQHRCAERRRPTRLDASPAPPCQAHHAKNNSLKIIRHLSSKRLLQCSTRSFI